MEGGGWFVLGVVVQKSVRVVVATCIIVLSVGLKRTKTNFWNKFRKGKQNV